MWSRLRGLKVGKPELLERRKNLSGVTLVNSIMPWSPYCIIDNTTSDGNPVNPTGLLIDLFNMLQEVIGGGLTVW